MGRRCEDEVVHATAQLWMSGVRVLELKGGLGLGRNRRGSYCQAEGTGPLWARWTQGTRDSGGAGGRSW